MIGCVGAQHNALHMMQAENPDENQKVGSDSDDTNEDDEEGDGLVGRPPASSSSGTAAVGE